jgi:Fe-S-cluster containining protein
MYQELFALAKELGATCETCKEICCINMALTIKKEEIQKIANKIGMDMIECRKKYTMLMKTWFKEAGTEWTACSKEGEDILRLNPRLLIFNEISMDKLPLTKEQKDRLNDMEREQLEKIKKNNKKENKKGKNEQKITVCPFFDGTTRRCKIHEVRPGACREFPINESNGYIDLRKVNACVISTKLLESIRDTVEELGIKQTYFSEVLKKKEYQNHFYVPIRLFLLWAVKECSKHNIPLTSPDLLGVSKILRDIGEGDRPDTCKEDVLK